MNRDRVHIVAAAVLYGGELYQGFRHADIMRRIWDERPEAKITQEMQGFVTSEGQFVNRFQAGAVAFTAGQTKHRFQTLISEHIWPEGSEPRGERPENTEAQTTGGVAKL